MLVGDCWLLCIKDCCKGRYEALAIGQSAVGGLYHEYSRQTVAEMSHCAATKMYINRYLVNATAYLFVCDIPATHFTCKYIIWQFMK